MTFFQLNGVVVVFAMAVVLRARAVESEDINDLFLKTLLGNLNETADPCEDFYQYACGSWVSDATLAEEYVDIPGQMDYMMNQQLLQVLQDERNASGIYAQVWDYYRSCTELTQPVLNHYLRLVQTDLDMTWPILRTEWDEPWQNDTHFDWLSVIAALRVYGFNGVLLTQHINVRLTNGTHHLLEVHQHESPPDLQQNHVELIFVNFGMTPEQSANVTSEVLALQDQLANLTLDAAVLDSSQADGKAYRERHKEWLGVQELADKMPAIDWRRYFRLVLGRELDSSALELIQTYSLSEQYFEELGTILAATSNETIAYYIMLKFMYYMNKDLPTSNGDRAMYCVNLLRGNMPLAMNYFYERHFYAAQREETDAALLEIFEVLRFHFRLLLKENHLGLNLTERAFLLKELRTMKLKVGNVPQQLTQQFVEQYYDGIRFNASDFYTNHLQLLQHATRLDQAALRNIAVPPELKFYNLAASTAISSSPVKLFDNVILVPYGFLRLPLFHHALKPLFQYSLFGFIFAHEIAHAFDLFHIVYDQQGNFNEMGIAVAQHFWEHIDCFAQAPNDNLSENIVDVAGLRLAFQTYFDDIAELEDTATYASTFTKQQLFFINSVQFLCANMAKISAMDVEFGDLGHDMHDVRVRQNWANFEEFGRAFNCSRETSMYPLKKCRLW